jgi:acetyl-CoA acetyltransferase
MRYQTFVRAAAGVLATAWLAAGGAYAQTPNKQPDPPTMVDTAPVPPHDRSSVGAIILMDEPVLAQREALMQAQQRSGVDTRSMGAGPNRMMRRALTKEEIELQKALDAAERRKTTPE